jgi:hypothetical protein
MTKLKTLGPRVATPPSRLKTVEPGSWRAVDATSTERGYGYAWQQARAGFLAKHPFCVRCLAEAGITSKGKAEVILECAERDIAVPWASVVDHRIPHRGDKQLFWDRDNWDPLCTPHHARDKQREEHEARQVR